MMISCLEASKLGLKASEKPLKLKDKLALKFHIMMCANCRRFGNQINVIRKVLHQQPLEIANHLHEVHLSNDKREEIKRKLK